MAAGADAGAGKPAEIAVDTATAMVISGLSFARELPEDAWLMLTIRPGDLLDGEPDAAFQQTLAAMNAPLSERIDALARQLYGSSGPRSVDAVARAVAELPYAVVRRHAYHEPMPS